MAIYIASEETVTVGEKCVVEGAATEGHFAVVFEDDGDTGYFYALDGTSEGNPIQDAMHIYNVADVADRNLPSVVKIGWSMDHSKAVLLINQYPHAIYDFSARQGYCRTNFPPPVVSAQWSAGGHAWNDEALNLFA